MRRFVGGSGLKGLANRLIPFWYPDVERILALDHAPSWIERAAGVWAIVNRLLCDAAPRFPRYLRVRYEDLFDDSHSGLRAVCEMLELPSRERDTAVAPGARMNESRLAALPDWRDWSPEQCLSLDRICAPLMREFGYGDEQEWRDRIAGERADD